MDALSTFLSGALELALMRMTFFTTLGEQSHSLTLICQDAFAGLDSPARQLIA
jgi:hypothetical protein